MTRTRFAARYRHDGCYIRHLTDGFEFGRRKFWTARAKVVFELSPKFNAVLEYQYDKADRTQGANSEFLPAVFCAFCNSSAYQLPVTNSYTIAQNVLNGGNSGKDTSHFYDLPLYFKGDAFMMTSTTAYRQMNDFETGRFDFTEADGVNISQVSGAKTFTQDLVASTNFHSIFNATAGFSYLDDKSFIDEWFFTGNSLPTRAPDVSNVVKTKSVSGFGEVTLELLQRLKLIGGVRYTNDRREIFDQHITFSPWTPRFVLSYNTGQANFYINYNRGLKAGGYSVPASTALVFLPKKIDSYEAGVKFETADRRIHAILAVFKYIYKNIQTNSVDQTDPNAISRT